MRRKPSGGNRSSTSSDAAKSPSVPPSPARRVSGVSTASSLDDRNSRRGTTLQSVTDEAEPSEEEAAASSARSHVRISSGRRRVSGESISSTRERSRTLTDAERPALRSFNSNTSQTDGLTAEQVAEMVSSPAVQDISERATRRLMAVEATRAARAKAEAKIAEAQPPVKSGKGAAAKGATVVPPINVLIVEGKFAAKR